MNSQIPDELNIAMVMRDICKQSNTTQKIIKKIKKAAETGKTRLKVKISEDIYNEINDYFTYGSSRYKIPALVEELVDLGFSVRNPHYTYGMFNRLYYIIVEW